MDFRTIVDIPKPDFNVAPLEKVLLVGSCFADNIGKRFQEERFPTVVNPYGVMYNPASILHTVSKVTARIRSGESDFIPSLAIFTLGTNHVYIEKATEEIVDNCRKRPQRLFREELLTIDECADYLRRAVHELRDCCGDINIVVTVSPIRYRKYGYHGSKLSKATLLLAADKLVQEEGIYYFPAYEIVNDELRDYRFYQPDMLHPSQQTVEFIWERFVDSCFSDAAKEYLREWKSVKEALGHRPLHPESDEYKEFLRKTQERFEALKKKYPGLK